MLTTPKQVQAFLRRVIAPNLIVDGNIGDKTKEAAYQLLLRNVPKDVLISWNWERRLTALEQTMFRTEGGLPVSFKIDGLLGPNTLDALEQWQNYLRRNHGVVYTPTVVPVSKPPLISGLRHNNWPRQKDCVAFYGAPGMNHAKAEMPFDLKIAWDPSTTTRKITCNVKVKDSLERIYLAILDHYGLEKIVELRLDMFGGCYNNRAMRGGSALSMHAFAVAIDNDPERNQLRWGRDRASFAKPEYAAYLDIWEAEGWVSLGRARNMDWMHTQAARL